MDPRLPAMLVAAGIATEEQAEKLAGLIQKALEDDHPGIMRGYVG